LGSESVKLIAKNKNAGFSYTISTDYEAGVVLVGSEVKSLRSGNVNLKDSYAQIKNGEIFVYQMHIGPYSYASRDNHDPLRPRKLLLHKNEIKKIIGKLNERGFSLIPMTLYFKNGRVKMKIGLGKGKKLFDKRQDIKDRESKREVDRANKYKEY
jgi:SsrA-binding protein